MYINNKILYTININQMKDHECNICNYSTTILTNFKKHLLTQKHKDKEALETLKTYNIKIEETINIKVEQVLNDKVEKVMKEIKINNDLMVEKIITNGNELSKKLDNKINSVERQIKTVGKKILNDNKVIKKALLPYLNQNYTLNPRIEYILEDEFNNWLECFYQFKIKNKDFKLQKQIIQDYKNNKLTGKIIEIILKIIKKDNMIEQSVFNTDVSRGNYATKMENFWLNDKSGINFIEYVIKPSANYMSLSLEPFRKELIKIRNKNIKNPSIKNSDILMNFAQNLIEIQKLLEDNDFHKQIAYKVCPHLRFNEEQLTIS